MLFDPAFDVDLQSCVRYCFESDDSVPTSQVHDRYKTGEGYHVVPPPHTGTFMPPKPDLIFHDAPTASQTVLDVTSDSEDESEIVSVPKQKAPSFVQTSEHVKPPKASVKPVEHSTQAENLRKDTHKSRGHKYSWIRKACFVCKSLNHLIKPVFPTTILTRSRLVPLHAARPVTTAVPHPTVSSPRPVNHVIHKAHSPIRRPIHHRPTPKNRNFHKTITTVKAKRGNPHQALKDKVVIDSGCSRHMETYLISLTLKKSMEDMLHLVESKRCVLQMCNKKNIILFTDTKCVVLSSDFKLPDENHVLLRVPRENNMYNVNLKNSMNYHPVIIGNQPNPSVSIKENIDTDPQNTNADAAFDVKENESKVHVTPSSSDKTKKHEEKAKREAKGNNMPALKEIVYSDDEKDVGVESMERMVKEQGGLNQINDEDFHTCMFACFLSQEEPKRVHQALKDPSWIEAMQEELLQFKMKKEVYVCQTFGFEDPDYPNKVYKVVKALYGLHQAPRAWCETLANYLLENGFQRGKIDQTLFIKKQKLKKKDDGIFISQDKYVAKILRKFGLTDGKSASILFTMRSLYSNILMIVDFLNAHTIQYGLMVNPPIYVSCIKQFWASVSLKKFNDVVKLQALIDRKKVVITEDTIRQDLRLEDDDGVECLPNEEILLS
nr:ribonuclease H-like domain-containing protein [Tanacetum cinerariifolium]